MKKHKPNYIPLKIRLWLALAAVVLFIFVVAELATGYSFLPGRGGGLLLSGVPALMLGLSALSLCCMALLAIIDHYDKRPNEHHYSVWRLRCLLGALYLFIAAPLTEVLRSVLLLFGIDIFPGIHGFASGFTFYHPGLQQYKVYIEPLMDMTLWVTGISLLIAVSAFILHKFLPRVPKVLLLASFAISMLGLSYMLMMFTLNDFLTGSIEHGGRVYSALHDPAIFNAILLTEFMVGFFLFMLSLAGIVWMLTNQKKLQADS